MAASRLPSLDIVSFLTRKFEHNFHALRMGFEHFDPSGSGFISRPDFRNVMMEYDFPMSVLDCEHFLERCGIRQPDSKVNYKELLLKFMSRADRDLANKIISDPNHRFNTRSFTPAGYLSAVDIEAKLVEYFHREFLQLLGSLRSLDHYNMGLITQKQLRDTIDRLFDVKISDFQLSQLLDEIGPEDDGLVSYEKFLLLFNKKRPWTLIGVQTITTPPVRTPKERPPTVIEEEVPVLPPKHEEEPVIEHKAKQTIPETPPEFEKKWEKEAKKAGLLEEEVKPYPLRNRPRKMLEDAIADILKTQFHSAQKAYHKIDRKAFGRISKPQFHKWLSELDIMLNVQELDDLWSTLQVSKDGIVHFSEIYGHFTQPKAEPPPIEDKLPMEDTTEMIEQMRRVKHVQKQRVKDLQDKTKLEKERKEKARMEKKIRRLSPTDQFSPPSDNVLERLRPHVVKNWNELKKQFRILDPNGYATVTRTEIKAILQALKFPLTPGEADKLCSRFDFNVNGHFHYMQFLELYTHPEKISPNAYKAEIPGKLEKHPLDSDKSSTLVAVIGRLKKKLLTDWKTLRRTFKKADVANEGHLDAAKFKQILLDSSIVTSEEDLFHLLSEFDKKLDGRICYDEFLNTMLS
ncbi:EF-hand calcium-binding domain-containing protein 6-like [Ptychodera flava]|uniref:EF-hand calcium-binding domain-containing protein 6-like n=1 Tax=Ptychodera flava TaxID=63121 RepID=UPI00396A1F87